MSPRNLASQINIFMRPTRTDKTNIPSMRRGVKKKTFKLSNKKLVNKSINNNVYDYCAQ